MLACSDGIWSKGLVRLRGRDGCCLLKCLDMSLVIRNSHLSKQRVQIVPPIFSMYNARVAEVKKRVLPCSWRGVCRSDDAVHRACTDPRR